MNIIQLRPFALSKEAQIIQFARSNPWKPIWVEKSIQEFIRQLTSSPDLVFDLFSLEGRVASAVLIDKIQNKGNSACLELLGVDQKYDLSQIYRISIQAAKRKLPRERSGIKITIHKSLNDLSALIVSVGFIPYYEIFEMNCNI